MFIYNDCCSWILLYFHLATCMSPRRLGFDFLLLLQIVDVPWNKSEKQIFSCNTYFDISIGDVNYASSASSSAGSVKGFAKENSINLILLVSNMLLGLQYRLESYIWRHVNLLFCWRLYTHIKRHVLVTYVCFMGKALSNIWHGLCLSAVILIFWYLVCSLVKKDPPEFWCLFV